MKLSIFNRITLSVTLLAVGAFSPNLYAGWSSLEGNNRNAPAQSAPRPQPQMRESQPVVHAPEPRPQPQINHPSQPVVRPQPQPTIRPEPQPVVHAPEPHQEIQPARPQPHIVEPVRPPVVDRAREQPAAARAGEADRRRMDIDEDRRQSYFWSDYHRGMHVDQLPDGYRRFRFHDHDYFYFEGVYYDDEPSGYVVVDAPVDADVPDLPPGDETVVANGTVYYYAAGVFYVQQADGSYVVVAAPMGVTVSMLPPDAVAVVINGMTYYQSDGTYYMPVMQNGVTAYLTVPQP